MVLRRWLPRRLSKWKGNTKGPHTLSIIIAQSWWLYRHIHCVWVWLKTYPLYRRIHCVWVWSKDCANDWRVYNTIWCFTVSHDACTFITDGVWQWLRKQFHIEVFHVWISLCHSFIHTFPLLFGRDHALYRARIMAIHVAALLILTGWITHDNWVLHNLITSVRSKAVTAQSPWLCNRDW